MFNLQGKKVILAIFRDITEHKQAEEALREREERLKLERDRLALILKTAQDAFWLVDASTGHLVDVNEASSSMLGYTRDELLTRGLTDIDAQWSPEEIGREIQKIKLTGKALFETRHRARDGQIIDVLVSVNYLPATDQIFLFIHNITNHKRYEEKLEHFAIHDQLTGLLNRYSLEDMLSRTIAKAKRGAFSSFLYMDLDNFKDVNDTVGHRAGDEVLITVAGLLKAALRTEDIVFRLGGDEFAVLLDGMAIRESLPAVERLRAIVKAHRFELGGRVFTLSLSIGIVEIDGTVATGELLSQADAAMYRAKEQVKDRVVEASVEVSRGKTRECDGKESSDYTT